MPTAGRDSIPSRKLERLRGQLRLLYSPQESHTPEGRALQDLRPSHQAPPLKGPHRLPTASPWQQASNTGTLGCRTGQKFTSLGLRFLTGTQRTVTHFQEITEMEKDVVYQRARPPQNAQSCSPSWTSATGPIACREFPHGCYDLP